MTRVEELHERLGFWRFALLSLVVWVVLWPVVIGWLVIAAICGYRRLDKSPAARTSRRVDRYLSWYPAPWRDRYGDELEQLLRDTIDSGHGGIRLTLNIARESALARYTSTGSTVGALCWSLCWIPLIPQGVVPLVLKLTGVSTRSWFLAMYLPAPLQWPVIAAMTAAGIAMLFTAIRLSPVNSPRAASD